MNSTDYIPQIKTIVQPYIQNQEAFDSMDLKTNFLKDLNINSANLVDVILDIEDEFDIVMENEDMEKMTTVASAIGVIQEKLDAK